MTRVKQVVRSWQTESQERAYVRFESAPGEQSQLDWGHFGNWGGRRLYGFAMTLGWSRMRYVEFTQNQDIETLLNCMVHAFIYLGGVSASVTCRQDLVTQFLRAHDENGLRERMMMLIKPKLLILDETGPGAGFFCRNMSLPTRQRTL